MALTTLLQHAATRCDQGGNGAGAEEFMQVLGTAIAEGKQSEASCEAVLIELRRLLDPNTVEGKELLDFVGWELPFVIVKFSRISKACNVLSINIINFLAASCTPREIFATLMEALSFYSRHENLDYCMALVDGLTVVLPRIKKRRVEFVKELIPALLLVAKLCEDRQEDDEELCEDRQEDDEESDDKTHSCRMETLEKLIAFSAALQDLCESEEVNAEKEIYRKLLGVYVLPLLAMTVKAYESDVVDKIFSELQKQLKYCGLTAPILLAGDLDKYISALPSDEGENIWFKSRLECGAVLAVVIGSEFQRLDVSDFDILRALNRSKNIFMMNYSWQLLEKGFELIRFLITHFNVCDDEEEMTIAVGILPLLQVIQQVTVHASSAKLRTCAYGVLTEILEKVVSVNGRFECVKSLISNCDHAAVVSLLLSFVRKQIVTYWPKPKSDVEFVKPNPFTSVDVLKLVQLVLHPKQHEFLAHLDAVAGGLNLYRFLIIREASGCSNYTGVRSRENLRKAKVEWLEPLRLMLSVLIANEDCEEVKVSIEWVQMILFRCFELVEDEAATLA